MNNKTRILLGIGLIIFSIGIGYLLFQVFFATDSIFLPSDSDTTDSQSNTTTFPVGTDRETTTGTQVPPTTGLLPSTGINSQVNNNTNQVPTEPIISTIFTGSAQNTTITNSGQVQFYNANDGKFYRIDTNGNIAALSEEVFFSADTVTWDNTGNTAIIEYPDGSNIVYDFETKQPVTLPKHWEDFSFSPEGQQIIAKSLPLSPENRWLITTDSSGNNVRLIEPLGENANKVIVDWSANSQVAAFSRTGQALGIDREQILLVGLNGENFKALTVEGRDFRPKWTPDGKRVLYSVYSERSGFRPELWIVNASGDAIGEGRTFLNINTWADKCDFGTDGSRYVYCAVPESLQEGAGFVPETAANVPDIIYQIDTITGSRTSITSLQDGSFTINNLHVDEENNKIFVTDATTNSIIEINI
jgi:Tol biopolymer transport system component